MLMDLSSEVIRGDLSCMDAGYLFPRVETRVQQVGSIWANSNETLLYGYWGFAFLAQVGWGKQVPLSDILKGVRSHGSELA